jgi:hypothetical protein
VTTGHKKALARTWSFIRHALDDDFETARSKLRWMPSHLSVCNLGACKDSRGGIVTAIMWRANRLADALAKSVSSRHRLPGWAIAVLKSGSTLLKYHAAKLGTATHKANHHEVQVMVEGGRTVTGFRRDSTAQRPAHRCGSRPTLPPEQPACASGATARQVTSSSAVRLPAVAASQQGRKRTADTAVHELRRTVAEETALARCLVAKRLAPASGPTGAERLSNVRERVLARIRKVSHGVVY